MAFIAAQTKNHSEYPGFISINSKEDGTVEISLRADKSPDEYVVLNLSADEWDELKTDINKNVE